MCGFATACTVRPCSRASFAVTGPMQTTFGAPSTASSAPDEPAHGRGARERDGVDLAGAQRVASLPRQRAGHARAVGVDARRATILSRRARPRGPAARCRRGRRAPGPSPRGKARASPVVVNVAGTRSGSRRAHRRKAAAVPSPIAATCVSPSARGPGSRRGAASSTVARLVSVIHANSPASRSRSARVSAAERAGAISIAGATIGRAPSRRSLDASGADWSAGRVTTTVRRGERLPGPAPDGGAHPASTSSRMRSAPCVDELLGRQRRGVLGGRRPAVSTRSTRRAVGRRDHARSGAIASTPTVARAPSGSAHPPPSRHIRERSASRARWLGA